MKTKTYLSLSFMMFLEFFIWGVWFFIIHVIDLKIYTTFSHAVS